MRVKTAKNRMQDKDREAAVQGHVAAITQGLQARGPKSGSHGLALAITAVLQTTLEVNRLVELFGQEMRQVVDFDSMEYTHAALVVRVQLGETPQRHACTYRLTLESHTLGEISFTRKQRFADAELTLIEALLCSLVYPLRNAIEFRNARELAQRDPLTGVYNRGTLDDLLRREVALARRHQQPFSVIFIDIDRFKTINDTLGHAVGDRVIKLFVECIGQKTRNTDIVARYGGDEFCVLLTNTPHDGAMLLAERMRASIEAAELRDDRGAPVRLTASMGVGSLGAGDTVETLLARADAGVNRAKQEGRNKVCD
jgi:diguanylate cyclase (GGDEF)-like protein